MMLTINNFHHTIWQIFKYLCGPYGISSISEHYDWRMAKAFTGFNGLRRIIDEIIIYYSDPQQHTTHVMQFL